jgi:hypothetical protein
MSDLWFSTIDIHLTFSGALFDSIDKVKGLSGDPQFLKSFSGNYRHRPFGEYSGNRSVRIQKSKVKKGAL